MPQLIVYMKVNILNVDCSNLKNNHFKLRHAPYSNRCGALKENETDKGKY